MRVDPVASTQTPAVTFDRVIVIYNPNSTGDAPALAEELRADLAERLPDLPVDLNPTEHAGHARTLAADAARSGRPLIVSVSGDGGYNEVVNGVMDVPGSKAVCTVVAAGNANDHHRSMPARPLPQAVLDDPVRHIDLLRITFGTEQPAQVHYAHSYIGFGLTPLMAIGIESGGKGNSSNLCPSPAHSLT